MERRRCGSRASASRAADGPCSATCPSTSRPGRSPPCSGRTAPASRRSCSPSPARSVPPRAPWCSATATSPGHRPEQIRQAGLAVVPEGRRLLPELSVADNLRVATYTLEREQAEHGTDYALELFPELKQRWTATARSLSGGEQQMVVLAQALVSRPAVILVDELSLGLAPLVVKRLVPILGSIAESGVGVLLIEQFAHVALGLANRAYVLQGGRIRYEGTAARAAGRSRPAPFGVPAAGLMEDLAGKVAVVTGGASGIGLAIGTRFAAEGMKVVLADVAHRGRREPGGAAMNPRLHVVGVTQRR